MTNARNFLMPGRVAAASALVLCCAATAVAQLGAWNGAARPIATGAPPRGPLARLVMNPDSISGAPPFALTDQTGSIQRYVEPVPGIDLSPYIDQVVVVRHDTGRTLLASQLELPPQPLYPLLGSNGGDPRTAPFTGHAPDGNILAVQAAQFADDDDATVQLLPDGEEPSDGDSPAATPQPAKDEAAVRSDTTDSEYLGVGEGLIEEAPVDCDPMLASPHLSGPMFPGHGGGPAFGGVPACTECGQFHMSPECGPAFSGPGMPVVEQPPQLCRYYASAEINLLRTHLGESAHGKLSERYEASPRVTVGFNETGAIDGRVRYWHYSQDTPILGGGRIDVDMDVLDIEGTHLLASPRFELLMGGGLRLSGIDVTDANNDAAGADLIGMTMFAEGRTPLCNLQDGRIAWVFGGRLSILGGDWGGDAGNNFTGGPFQDDNLVVHELHTGVVYGVRRYDYDFHARLGFEMQNWHSDALSQNGGGDSIGFLGPGIQVGAGF
ncbi:MAG TPA: hypothetical protein VGK58_14985 [Lacipirellulaceae bacterium]